MTKRRRAVCCAAVLCVLLAAATAQAGTQVTRSSIGPLGGSHTGTNDMNDAGQVVGARNTGVGSIYHAFLWSKETGVMEDLGTLGGSLSVANRINSAGQVVGFARDSAERVRAFIRTPGSAMIDLGTFSLDYQHAVVAEDINEAGQVAGYAMNNFTYRYRSFIITPLDADGDGRPDTWFRDENGDGTNDLMVDIGIDGALNRINNAGQVMIYDNSRSYVWQNGTATVLGSLGSGGAVALAINDRGWVTGFSSTATSYAKVPFFWRDGMMVPVPLPAGCSELTWGNMAMNDAGQVVGYCYDAAGRRGFVWDESTGTTDIGTLGGAISDAMDINNSGQVTGQSQLASGEIHAFLWSRETGMTDLEPLAPAGSYSTGFKINEQGWVAGIDNAQGRYGVLWQVDFAPVPSASAIAVTEPNAGTTRVLPNDPDRGDRHTYAIAQAPANGSAAADPDGVVTYTPAPGFAGSDSFVVRVTDQGGAFGDVTIPATVNPERVPPSSAASPGPGLYQQSVTVTLAAADNLDPSPKILYTTDGTDPRTGGLLYAGSLVLTNDTLLQFAAVDRRNNWEAAVHSTNYTVNHAPVPAAPALQVRTGKTATSLISPHDPDPADTVFTYAVTVPPVHGTASVSAAGLVTFTADKKYAGPDSITVGVQDPRGGAATVTIPVTVSK